MSILAINGSSRADGETARLLQATLRPLDDVMQFDLGALRIGSYSYSHANSDDDFLTLARAMLKARTLILASPVYWYSMSAQMKTFFDRLTDLTDAPYKALGKQLAGKTMFVVATGSRDAPPLSFVEPFSGTAGYFNMRWGGMLYRRGADALSAEDIIAAREFSERIASGEW
jgi:multimeric flavodoxin WrbA